MIMEKRSININREAQQSVRIQTSVFNALEKSILVGIAKRLPKWVKSDGLTAFGIFGSMVVALGFILSNIDIHYLWLSSLGLVINWFGDSLDGTIARVRGTQRRIYGFFLDHNVDGITISIMAIGAGLSPFVHLPLAMGVLVSYLLLSIYVYISAHLKGEFKLTYAKMGPTEFRILIILMNTVFMYVPCIRDFRRDFTVFDRTMTFTLFDYGVALIMIILLVIYVTTLVQDIRAYAILDPLPEPKTDESSDRCH